MKKKVSKKTKESSIHTTIKALIKQVLVEKGSVEESLNLILDSVDAARVATVEALADMSRLEDPSDLRDVAELLDVLFSAGELSKRLNVMKGVDASY